MILGNSAFAENNIEKKPMYFDPFEPFSILGKVKLLCLQIYPDYNNKFLRDLESGKHDSFI